MSPPLPTTIHLVRHGAVDNPDEIYYGRDFNLPLSEEGRGQAAAAGMALEKRPIAAIYHSPLLRTTQTANILADLVNPPRGLQPEDALLEVYSPYDGVLMAELEAREWDLYSGTPPPYEQPGDILSRLHRFIRQAAAAHPGKEVIGVTHGDVVAFALMWGFGRPVIPGEKNNFQQLGLPDAYPATASITTLLIDQLPPAQPVQLSYKNPVLQI